MRRTERVDEYEKLEMSTRENWIRLRGPMRVHYAVLFINAWRGSQCSRFDAFQLSRTCMHTCIFEMSAPRTRVLVASTRECPSWESIVRWGSLASQPLWNAHSNLYSFCRVRLTYVYFLYHSPRDTTPKCICLPQKDQMDETNKRTTNLWNMISLRFNRASVLESQLFKSQI